MDKLEETKSGWVILVFLLSAAFFGTIFATLLADFAARGFPVRHQHEQISDSEGKFETPALDPGIGQDLSPKM